jgi:uncharacterized LabA/DUF88 family protein
MRVYAFIDASNLFYGGEKSLGWKVDYLGLLRYLKEKYGVSKAFYFGGVETHGFPYDYQTNETVPLKPLKSHLLNLLKNDNEKKLNEAELLLIGRHLQRVKFYMKLEIFGYSLFLKPVKLYDQDEGLTKRKANCDVDMTFHLMKEKNSFDKAVILSGDGDFLPILKHLRESRKDITILARSKRTAREIRQFAGSNFRDFEYLKNMLKVS